MRYQPKHLKKMSRKKKIRLTVLSIALSVCLLFSVAGTYAWMVTAAANNGASFSNSTIVAPQVTQGSTVSSAAMVPGSTIPFKATVTVPKGNNFDYYLFIKVAKGGSLDSYLDYSYTSNWKSYSSSTSADILYLEGAPTTSGSFACDVFTNNNLKVQTDNTNSDKNAAPSITITAALVQKEARNETQAYSVITNIL